MLQGNTIFVILVCVWLINGPQREKTLSSVFVNNKDADQPAHLRSLISAFIIHLFESSISKLATSKISIISLVSVAGDTGFSPALLESPMTGFVVRKPKQYHYMVATTLIWNILKDLQ